MKKEFLEYLIRECVKGVLEAFPTNPNADTVGAPAPPAGGLGTADQPALSADQSTGIPVTADTKGVWFIDPKNKNKKTPIKLNAQDPTKMEQELRHLVTKSVGPNVMVAKTTIQTVMNSLSNPNIPSFLYVGKQNPNDASGNLFLMASPSYEKAKSLTVTPNATPAPADQLAPARPAPKQPGNPDDQPVAKTTAPDINEGMKFRSMISSIINEVLNEQGK